MTCRFVTTTPVAWINTPDPNVSGVEMVTSEGLAFLKTSDAEFLSCALGSPADSASTASRTEQQKRMRNTSRPEAAVHLSLCCTNSSERETKVGPRGILDAGGLLRLNGLRLSWPNDRLRERKAGQSAGGYIGEGWSPVA